MVKRLLIVAVILGAGVWTARRVLNRPLPQLQTSQPALRGAFHIHSEASHDSDETLETLAGIAQAQGLQFLVVTDRNNQLPKPISVKGITILSYAKLTTPYGHVVQMGAGYVTPPKERSTPNLHQAIRELGGIPVIAHPGDTDHPWAYDGPTEGAGGVEIAHLASSIRRRSAPLSLGLLPSILAARFRPKLAFAQLLDRDTRALGIWDSFDDPGVVGLCGIGNYARLPTHTELMGWQIVLDAPLPFDHQQLPPAILEHLARGRFHCIARVFGENPTFSFTAQDDGTVVGRPGDSVALEQVEDLIIRGPTSQVPLDIVLFRNGEPVVRTQGDSLDYRHPAPGSYRVEILMPIPKMVMGSRQVPVIYSNRIRVLEREPEPLPDANLKPGPEPKAEQEPVEEDSGPGEETEPVPSPPAERLEPVPTP